MRHNNYYPTRKAILIGCPGGGATKFLSGVQQDLENVSNFLQSQSGGVWNDGEIRTLYNATQLDVQKAIRNAVADYVFVYFSGHGALNATTQGQVLCLKDQDVSDRILFNSSPRQLIVIDACRKEAPPAISGIPELLPEFDYFAGSPARQLFDDCIRNSLAGKIIVYSTNKGTFSFDSATGGVFTNALLQIGGTIVMKKSYTPFEIGSLLGATQQLLRKQHNFQIPSAVNLTGKLTVPFAIGIPQSELPTTKVPQQNLTISGAPSSNGGWLALGLGLLIIAIAASNSKK